jgi:UDP-N-acetylmuramoylalanine--D-glutamate ligase
MDFKSIEDKNILILGLGREGESTFKFLRSVFPEKILFLADQIELTKLPNRLKNLLENDGKVILSLGQHYLDSIKSSHVIFKSPGIPHKTISPYLEKKHIVFSQIEIFLKDRGHDCMGITGTKGKSTTSSLIHHILKNNRIKSKLIGNIGKPVFAYLQGEDKQKFVIELSSHQLNLCEASPHISVFLNIFKEHLDYYNSFDEYFQAKVNITKWQKENDYFIYNSDFKELKKVAKSSKARVISFGFKGKPMISLKNNCIFSKNQLVIPIADIPLKGDHNILNTMAAIGVAKMLNISNEKITVAIKTFKPLLHRMELFSTHNGVDFYNDSIATIPEATIQIINTIPNISTLILGGLDRGQYFNSLAKVIISKRIQNIILFPENDKKIANIIKEVKGEKPKIFFAKNMREATKIAFKESSGGACVLSPASASYNLFKDFKDRGEKFKKYIRILIKND